MKKVSIEEKRKIITYIDWNIKNADIYNCICENIEKYSNERNKNLYIENNKVVGRTKKSKDSFILELGNNIKFTNITLDGRNIKELVLKKDDEIIIVESTEINKIVSSTTDELTEIQREFNRKIYINNKYRHEVKEQYITSAIIEKNASSASLWEIYVDENGKGVSKEVSMYEEKDTHSSNVIYRSTNHYDKTPFNTREEQDKSLYIIKMESATENEFNNVKEVVKEKIKGTNRF